MPISKERPRTAASLGETGKDFPSTTVREPKGGTAEEGLKATQARRRRGDELFDCEGEFLLGRIVPNKLK